MYQLWLQHKIHPKSVVLNGKYLLFTSLKTSWVILVSAGVIHASLISVWLELALVILAELLHVFKSWLSIGGTRCHVVSISPVGLSKKVEAGGPIK